MTESMGTCRLNLTGHYMWTCPVIKLHNRPKLDKGSKSQIIICEQIPVRSEVSIGIAGQT